MTKQANDLQPPSLSCYTCAYTDEDPGNAIQGTGCTEQAGAHSCYASWVDFDGDG